MQAIAIATMGNPKHLLRHFLYYHNYATWDTTTALLVTHSNFRVSFN